MSTQSIRNIFRSRHLSLRQQYCLAIASLVTVGERSRAYRLVLRGRTRHKIPQRFFAELFIHLSLFLGYPVMLEGLQQLEKMNGKSRRARGGRRRKSARYTAGMKIITSIYGRQTQKLIDRLRELHQELPEWIIEDAYGRVFDRPGLTLQEREVTNIAVLVLQDYPPQLVSHIRGALCVGLSPNAVRASVAYATNLAAEFGRAVHLKLNELVDRDRRSTSAR